MERHLPLAELCFERLRALKGGDPKEPLTFEILKYQLIFQMNHTIL